MNSFPGLRLFAIICLAVMLSACGGSSSAPPPTDDGGQQTQILSGTAAAGAPIVGTVTVKDALGNTRSALIEADGNYNVDVSGMTAPFRLRAEGTVGGRTYRLHSYAEEADVGGTVNITPFTDLIVANAAGQIAEQFFESNTETSIEPAELEAQEEALQAKLQNVFDALGLGTAIDLLNQSFSADKSGLDAALDAVRIEVDPVLNQATITNLVNQDAPPIVDDLLDSEDNNEALAVTDPNAISNNASTNQTIADMIADFTATFANGLPTPAQIDDFITDDFLEWDSGKSAFITDITTAPELIGLQFAGLDISDLDTEQGTATIEFNARIGGVIERGATSGFPWFVRNDPTLGWQLRGNQLIADVQELSYHCADSDPNDQAVGGCVINTAVFDNDFNNNGTGGQPIASATVSLIDGQNPANTKAVIYLGNPDFAAPGQLNIYNVPEQGQQQGFYSGDSRLLGTGTNQIDPALFEVGDTIEYRLYSQALDVTDPANPSVPVGQEVATYTSAVLFEPSLTPLFPSATPATVSAINSFALDNDLTVAWTLSAGTLIDEVLVEISDNNGNRIEIFDESMTSDDTSTTISAAQLSSSAASTAGLDSTAASYALMVRIYAVDPTTGQFHSQTYHAEIPGPGAGAPSPAPFTLQEIANSTVYSSFPSEDPDCGTGYVVESVVYTDTTYTLNFCDETTEQGTFQVVNGDIQWNLPGGGTEFIRRVVADNGAGGWVDCIRDTQAELAGCSTSPSDIGNTNTFTSLPTAQAFADAANIVPPRNIEVGFAFVQNREFENVNQPQDHRGIIGLRENGVYLPTSEIVSATLTGPSGTVVPDAADPVPNVFSGSILRLGSWNPTTQVFDSITEFEETGVIVRQSVTILPAGTYTFDVNLTDGTQFSRDISFPGTASAPLVPASSIAGTFQPDGSFNISWTEPAAAFDQYRVFVSVDDSNLRVRAHLSAGVESISIPANVMASLLSGSLDSDVEIQVQTRLQDTLGNHARNHSNVVSVAIPQNTANFGTIVGAWGNSDSNAPGMLVFYAHGGYINYQTDAQDCPGGGVEYGTYSIDGNSLTISNVIDENGQCGLKGLGAPAEFTYTANIVNNGNQLDIISGVPEDGTASFPRVSTGDPNSIVGGWEPFSSLEPDGGVVFYANGNYIVHQAAGSDPNCAAGGVEYGTYSYDGTTLSGNSVIDNNQTCGLSEGQGGFSFPVTIANNVFFGSEADGDQFPRVEASAPSSFDMTQFRASSVITYDQCPEVPGGWEYSFAATSMTLTGTDGWQTPECTQTPSETFSIDMPQAPGFDIPFNCPSYPICTLDDFNGEISGTDQDRQFTSTYSFNSQTNVLTYTMTEVEGTFTFVFTETISIIPLP